MPKPSGPISYPGVHKRHAKHCDQRGDDETTCGCPWSFTAERVVRGKRHREARSGFSSKTAANSARQTWLRDESDEPQARGRHTVAEEVERWLSYRATGTAELEPLRPTTLVSYRQHLRQYLVQRIGDMRIADVRLADVRDFRSWLRRERPDLSLATQDRVYATVRVFLRDCFDAELIAVDPTVRRQERKRKGKRKRPTFSTFEPEQFARFLTWLYARDERLAPVIAFAGYTGLRRGEVAGLSWLDVNMRTGVVTVRQQLLDVSGKLDLYAPKTASGTNRKVDVDVVVLDVLRDQQRRQAADREVLGEGYQEAGVVFTRPDGSALHPMTLTKTFPRLIRAYNDEQTDPSLRLPVLTFHSLRHHAASAALAGGTDLAVVSKRLGHASITVTSDYYSHLVAGAGRQAAEATSDVIGWHLPAASPHLPHIAATPEPSGRVEGGMTTR